MLRLYDSIAGNPEYFRQFSCGDSLITKYNCPLEDRLVDLWTRHNYFIYVAEGRKIWHTPEGSFDLRKGSCVFVRKGASIVEQFFETPFCLILFFVTDEFICSTLGSRSSPLHHSSQRPPEPVMPLHKSKTLESFFETMATYFIASCEPDKTLLELKFRELILTVADDPLNSQVISYFRTIMQEPLSNLLQRVMEDNFSFNLKLNEYAELCHRSLSAFKRDFQKLFGTTPGKWLLEKRLQHAKHLLAHMNKTVSEAAFESGFESPSHFSRSFKERFGNSPTALKHPMLT